MTLTSYKIIAAVLIFLASLVAVIYPLKRKQALQHTEPLHLGEAIASGIFLGAAFFHMLPEAIHSFGALYPAISYPIPEAICVLGFLFLLFLERLSTAYSKQSLPYILVIILTIHALVEGAALGIGESFSEAIMIFVAILAHKGSESFALCMTLLRHQLSLRRTWLIIVFFALMTPLGIGVGTTVNLLAFTKHGELMEALFNAFAAGTFLYMSTLHHVSFHQHEGAAQHRLEFACLAFGLITMAVIAIWA